MLAEKTKRIDNNRTTETKNLALKTIEVGETGSE